MGIPHLISYLRPFASFVDLAGQNVVIDGPGLAYHVWHICLASQPRFRNPFEATPSYALLGETVIRLLDELQAHNVYVKKIFFDGFLPSKKRPTRLGRVAKYTKQLHDYHQTWPQIIPSMYASTASQLPMMKLFNVEAVPSSFAGLPAAPFLVPAIIESLSTCDRYCSAVEVVPGEADLYCAYYVREHSGVVLTGDSDLLVHDLGTGKVAFFRDIDIGTTANVESLTCVQYNVSEIAARLSLPITHGLRSLAFEMTLNTHGSFRELLRQAVQLKAVLLHETMYKEFASEYNPNLDLQKVQQAESSVSCCPSLSCRLRSLDPRISEFVLQFSIFSQASELPRSLLVFPANVQNNIDIFLPFLLDYPCRTSSWEMSKSVRQLAYALVKLVLSKDEQFNTVVEYRRLQTGTRGLELSIPSSQDIPEACATLIELFNQIRGAVPEIITKDIWQAVAIYQDIAFLSSRGEAGLTGTVRSVPKSRNSSQFRWTWDGIQSFSQYQGSYYSFRYLKQILEVVLSCGGTNMLPPILYQLQRELCTLPTLAELPSIMDYMRSPRGPKEEAILRLAQKLLNLKDDTCTTSKDHNSQEGNKPKKIGKLKGKARQERSNNTYGVLAIE